MALKCEKFIRKIKLIYTMAMPLHDSSQKTLFMFIRENFIHKSFSYTVFYCNKILYRSRDASEDWSVV